MDFTKYYEAREKIIEIMGKDLLGPLSENEVGISSVPVPAGIKCPVITFSLKPFKLSTRPIVADSVRIRVVSWNDAAEMKLSVSSAALVIPRRIGSASAGLPPRTGPCGL